MNVADTSRQAYAAIQDKLGHRQEEVYLAIKEMGKASNESIAEHLGWPINRVTGRVTELKRFGLVDVEGLTHNKTGFTAKLWSVRDPNDTKLTEIADCGA